MGALNYKVVQEYTLSRFSVVMDTKSLPTPYSNCLPCAPTFFSLYDQPNALWARAVELIQSRSILYLGSGAQWV